MDNSYIQSAQASYASRDYRGALAAYSQCLSDPSMVFAPGDLGYLYHQIGNCFLQLQDFNQAIAAYTQSTADSAYEAVGAVNCNLGKAYAFLRDYEDAVTHFEIAVSDASYETPYKAYLGMGNALLKLGKNAEAGVAYRSAALDPANPDPTKALLNLGVCFMALNRPEDAVASYLSALQFDMDAETRNRMNASLGQAYVSCGQMDKAMDAFEAALQDGTYYLSDSASVDYARAAQSVATAPAVEDGPEYDMSGLDVSADGTNLSATGSYYFEDIAPEGQYYPEDEYGYEVDDRYADPSERFLYATEDELVSYGKQIAKKDRKRRNVGLKILVAFFTLLLVAAAGAVFLYTQGYGYPTQQNVVEGFFSNTDKASEYFTESLSQDRVASMMKSVPEDCIITIDGVEQSMSSSTVYVTAKTADGGELNYRVEMVRDLVGWKISDVELYFLSQQ
ncbi:MAG: tetratricopeptide repeat protein [Eggerthellales bacterium]|nr:tetratricopeptide repeat protein [Eggerthellales bacterium]